MVSVPVIFTASVVRDSLTSPSLQILNFGFLTLVICVAMLISGLVTICKCRGEGTEITETDAPTCGSGQPPWNCQVRCLISGSFLLLVL